MWLTNGLIKTITISTYKGPVTTILGNPDLSPRQFGRGLFKFTSYLISPIFNAFSKSNLKSLWEILEGSEQMQGNWLEYFQLRNFYKNLINMGPIHRPLTSFEKLCLGLQAPSYPISTIYALLLSASTARVPYYIAEWER